PNNLCALSALKDPRAEETIAQYAERQIALDLAKNSSLYSAANNATINLRMLSSPQSYCHQ
ncbi:MAG: hypothetical protein II863_00600, partial [Kiritimatiellae bacterium]|nr:hypothetical protein [Kiritimatiellia bacterium]